MTAVQIALMTIYDMCKYLDRAMEITKVRLLTKPVESQVIIELIKMIKKISYFLITIILIYFLFFFLFDINDYKKIREFISKS